ncbi:hypothetical protein M0R45_034974 [Rubus argutus]|uniref:Uncharacterized protein n=1 Tax=Rubus argutus TaxID=59490 RepID=A0AAW1VRR5_RUBAR
MVLQNQADGYESRLWHHKESSTVLREKSGTETIEGFELDLQRLLAVTPSININEIVLETNAFARMHKLRLLRLSHLQLTGCYEEFPRGLRWLCWIAFPLDSIPIDFPLENLVVLEMQYSSLRQIWNGPKCLPTLKSLDLSHSHGITVSTDFSACANLEKLVLVDCAGLIDVHGSIGKLKRLVCLNLKDCKNLRMLPNKVSNLKLLETLVISGCTNLNRSSVELMRSMESLKVLEMDGLCNWQSMTTNIRMHKPHGDCQYYQTSIQGLYQYGIVSTFLPGNEVPGQFSHKSREGSSSSISFTVPLHPNIRFRGLNIFVVYANYDNIYPMLSRGDRFRNCRDFCISAPFLTKVSNKSKGLKWIYGPVCYGIPGWGEDMIWLSHWKLEDQLEGGDEVIISVCVQHDEFQFEVKEWGVEVVQEEQEESMSITSTQDHTTDPHVIGGDLSTYEVQKMPGTYWLLSYTYATIENLALERPILFNNLIRDSDEHTDKEQEEEEKKGEHQMLTETRADSNNCGDRVSKVLTIVAGFIQFICSPIWCQRVNSSFSFCGGRFN